ncbi:hypothetical protein V500_03780, partial [Pseudogymnoascus sp. VKM F-4518 (FW-2643)]
MGFPAFVAGAHDVKPTLTAEQLPPTDIRSSLNETAQHTSRKDLSFVFILRNTHLCERDYSPQLTHHSHALPERTPHIRSRTTTTTMGDNSASSSGSADTPASDAAHHSEQEINVLITGFGPFKAQYPINPSWEIARSLPSTLRLPPSSRAPGGTKVNLRVHPRAVRVAYSVVDSVVPGLWEGEDGWRPDWGVHIGMAAGREFYCLEKRAAGWGYTVGDVEGCLPDKEGVLGEVLEPGIGVDEV